MKYFILVFIVTLPLSKFCFSQNSWATQTFSKVCTDSTYQWDSIAFNGKIIKFNLVEKTYDHTDQNRNHFFNGKIIIDVDKKSLGRKKTKALLGEIAEKLNIYEMWAFKTCRAYNISISAMGAVTIESKAYYKNNYVGYVDRNKK